MSDKEINKLKKDILKVLSKNWRYGKIKNLQEIKEKTYELKVVCPYCNEETTYKNLYLENKKYFAEFIMCRACLMRFVIISPAKRIVQKLSPQIQPLMESYIRIKNRLRSL